PEPDRAANPQTEPAHAEPVRVTERPRGKAGRALDLQERQVDPIVPPDHLARKPLAAVPANLDGPGPVHPVSVGDDKPARIDDEARASAAPGLRAVLTGRVLFQRPLAADVDQPGLEPLGEIGERGIEPRQ